MSGSDPHGPQTPAPDGQGAAATVGSCGLDPDISRLIRLQGARQEALIEVLHAVQQQQGHLSPAALRQVAQQLELPASRVYGVASFYHLFQLQPPSPHRCSVCLGTACFVRGAGPLLERLSRLLALAPDPSAPAGAWSLQSVSCVGACGQAPVLLVDGRPLPDPLPDGDAALRAALAAAGVPLPVAPVPARDR